MSIWLYNQLMVKTPLFKRTFSLLFVVGCLAVSADTFYLYWTNWWLDSIVHFLAGVTVGMTGILVWHFYFKSIPRVPKSILIATTCVIIVGILWEVYELYFGIESILDGMYYFVDTTSDILLDILGALFGGLYAHRILIKNNSI